MKIQQSLQAQAKGLAKWVAEVNETIAPKNLSFGDFLTAAMKHFQDMKKKSSVKSEKAQASSDEDGGAEEEREGDEEMEEDEEEDYVEEESVADEFDIESDDFKQRFVLFNSSMDVCCC